MDDLENSPLLRVFNRKEKPVAFSRNVSSSSRLSRKKDKNAEIQKPLRVLQSHTVDEHKSSEISSYCGALCENGLTVSCSVEDRKKTFVPEANSPRPCTNSSSLFNSVRSVHCEYVSDSNHFDLLDSGKVKSCSSKTELIDDNSCHNKMNESIINLTSDDESNSPCSEPSNNVVNIHTEQLVTNYRTLSSQKTDKFIESPPKSQVKHTIKESLDARCVQQNDHDIVRGGHFSEDHNSNFAANRTVELTSDKSSDGDIDNVCKYLKNLEVSGDPPTKNFACEIPHTPEKGPAKCGVPSTVKKLQVLQSFFSSDEDCSPPPLSKRLLMGKQNDAPSVESTAKDVTPRYIKKKAAPASLEYVKKDVILSPGKYASQDTAFSSPVCINTDASPSPVMCNKTKGISSWKNTREDDSEVSPSSEGSDGSESDEESGSSGSDDFEQFLLQLKTPLKKEVRNLTNKRATGTRNFMGTGKTEQKKISSCGSSPPVPKIKVGSRVLSNQPSDIRPNHSNTKDTEKSSSSNSDDDSTDLTFPSKPSEAKVISTQSHLKASSQKASFLASLSTDVPNSLADPAALIYRNQFLKKKKELVEKLFALYNHKVFNDKLPKDMKVTWNPNLRKTAGTCASKRDPSAPLGRVSRIELAPKVLDSADRVRDTLVHEMCHAACWLIHGIRGGHGSLWKFWASRVHQVFPDTPPITRCHQYKISTKYVYVCTGCGGKIGRHSKSIDIMKSVCSRCKSKFELVVNGKTAKTSSKPTTGFAVFVKENYGNLKKQHAGVKHGDIMKMLSAEFSKTKNSV